MKYVFMFMFGCTRAREFPPVSSVTAESGTRRIGKIMRSPMLSTPKP